jgi:TPR repeat protein
MKLLGKTLVCFSLLLAPLKLAPLAHAAEKVEKSGKAGKSAAAVAADNMSTAKKTIAESQAFAAKKLFEQLGELEDAGQYKAKFEELRALADAGNTQAASYTAVTLYPRYKAEAFTYILKSFANQAPMPRQMLLIQGLQCNGGFDEKMVLNAANRQLEAAAANADMKATALIVLGLLNEYGGGGIVSSKPRALDYFRQAAELGNAFGLTLQGRIHEFDGGNDVPVDQAKALELYKAAAARNDPHGIRLLAMLNKELGNAGGNADGKEQAWEAAIRKSASLGNEGAMVDLGEWLLNKADEKSRQEGQGWLDMGIRMQSSYAHNRFAQALEQGKIASEHPIALAWVRYRDEAGFPCGSPTGPDGMARLLPRLHAEPAAAIASISKDGVGGAALALLKLDPANRNVRQAVWQWLFSQDNRAPFEHKYALWKATALEKVQYDDRDAFADVSAYAASLFEPLDGLLRETEVYLNNAAEIEAAFDQRLHRNVALPDAARASLAAALRAQLTSVNQKARARAETLQAAADARFEARVRQDKHDAWRAFKNLHPDALSEDAFRRCIAATDRLDQMAEDIDRQDARLSSKASAIDVLQSIYQVGASMPGGHMESTRININNSVREYNAGVRELKQERARFDSMTAQAKNDCSERRAAQSMIEELCAPHPENRFCGGFSR